MVASLISLLMIIFFWGVFYPSIFGFIIFLHLTILFYVLYRAKNAQYYNRVDKPEYEDVLDYFLEKRELFYRFFKIFRRWMIVFAAVCVGIILAVIVFMVLVAVLSVLLGVTIISVPAITALFTSSGISAGQILALLVQNI